MRKDREFSAKRWEFLGNELERAYRVVPFLSFKTAKAMCKTLAAMAEIKRVLNEKIPKQTEKETL